MDDARKRPETEISRARTPAEIGEFWDTHSLADHADEIREVDFEVRAQRQRRITLAPELYQRLEAQARRLGLMPESLANRWLSERLEKAGTG